MVEYDAETIERIERATGGRFWATSATGILIEHDYEWLVEYEYSEIEQLIGEGER